MGRKLLCAALLVGLFTCGLHAIEPFNLKEYQQESDYTENQLFCISDRTGLEKLADLVNSEALFSFEGKTIYLTDDITLDYTYLKTIGNDSNPFSGTFDGQGRSIKEMKMGTTGLLGLFGFIRNASIYNLSISDGEVDNNDSGYAGILVARAEATKGTSRIMNCHVQGAFLKGLKGGCLVGGLEVKDGSSFIISGCSAEIDEIDVFYTSGGLIGELNVVNSSFYLINSYSASSSLISHNTGPGGLIGSIQGTGDTYIETIRIMLMILSSINNGMKVILLPFRYIQFYWK